MPIMKKLPWNRLRIAVICSLVMAASHLTLEAACFTPPSGLVSWWKGESNAVDVLGVNSGVLDGTIGFAAGEVGRAFAFTATNADVKMPASSSLNVGLGGGFTVETWVNPVSAAGPRNPLFEWNNGSGLWGAHFYIVENGALNANIVDNGGAWHQITSGTGVMVANVFQHVALTYNKTSGVATIYRNGLVVAQQGLGNFTPQTSYDLYLGRRISGSGPGDIWDFLGLIDEPAIYNRALSSNEVAFVYQAGTAGKCTPAPPPNCFSPPSGLVSWWRGESNALDSADGNNGVLEGGLGFAAGEVGQAFAFNSITQDMRVLASASLNVGTNAGLTIESWINPSDTSQLHPIAEWNTGGSWGVHFYVGAGGPGSLYANVVDSGGNWHQISSATGIVLSNVLQHVALTYNKASGVATIYRNGTVVVQANLGTFTPLTTYNLYLGRRPPGGPDTYTFAGLLDELSLYNRALSSNEVGSVFLAGSAGKCAIIPPPTCFAPPSGLVSWWRGESNAVDVVGVNNGLLDGTIGFAAGEVGRAFTFTATNADVKMPASSSLNVGLGGGFTVEAWINPVSASGPRDPLFEWNNGTGNWGAHFYIVENGALNANIVDSGGAWHQITSGTGVMVANVFQHVALTYDKSSGVATVYRNGVVVAQQNLGSFTPQTSYDLYLGRRISGSGPGDIWDFLGLIDEPALYNRALSLSEVNSIYLAGTAGKCVPPPPPTCFTPPAGLVSWWRGEGNALDSADGNNGVMQESIRFASAKVHRGFLFNNINANIKIPAAANLNVGTGSGLTIETWINPTNVALRSPLVEWNDGNGVWGVHLWVSPDAPGQLFANLVDSGGVWHPLSSSAGVVVSNVFQHVALTYDKSSGVGILYYNGAIVAQASLGSFTPLTTYDLYLGRRISGAPGDTATFFGVMDETAVYNRALSQGEIQSIFNAASLGKCTTNHPPIAVADALPTPKNISAVFTATKIKLNDLDADGDPLTVIGVSGGSAQGGVVSLVAGQVTYTPPSGFAGNDTFTYTVSDGLGGTAVGTVTVTVGGGGLVSLNIVFGPMVGGGNFIVRFAGIPGLTYTVEWANTLSGPWTKAANITAPTGEQGFGVGVFEFHEPVNGNPSRFYRTLYPSY